MDMNHLKNKLKERKNIVKTQLKEMKSLKKIINENKDRIDDSNEKNLAGIRNAERMISLLERTVDDLRGTEWLSELSTYTFVRRRHNYCHKPEYTENEREYFAPIITHADAKDDFHTGVDTNTVIPIKYLEKLVGIELDSQVNKKIPIKLYRLGETVVNVEPRTDKDYPLFKKTRVKIEDRPEMKDWINKVITDYFIPHLEKERSKKSTLEGKDPYWCIREEKNKLDT